MKNLGLNENEADQFISAYGHQAIKIGSIIEKDTFSVSIGS